MTTNTFTPERREVFLEVLADTCSPKAAAAAAGVSKQTCYYHREKDVDFKLAWDKAVGLALDAVLEETYRRAITGVDEPVVYQGDIAKGANGEPLTVKRYSDRLLELLMRWKYPDQMEDKLRVRVEDTGLSPEALLAMPGEERAALVALLSKYRAATPAREDDDEA